jgi:hypothetical protein
MFFKDIENKTWEQWAPVMEALVTRNQENMSFKYQAGIEQENALTRQAVGHQQTLERDRAQHQLTLLQQESQALNQRWLDSSNNQEKAELETQLARIENQTNALELQMGDKTPAEFSIIPQKDQVRKNVKSMVADRLDNWNEPGLGSADFALDDEDNDIMAGNIINEAETILADSARAFQNATLSGQTPPKLLTPAEAVNLATGNATARYVLSKKAGTKNLGSMRGLTVEEAAIEAKDIDREFNKPGSQWAEYVPQWGTWNDAQKQNYILRLGSLQGTLGAGPSNTGFGKAGVEVPTSEAQAARAAGTPTEKATQAIVEQEQGNTPQAYEEYSSQISELDATARRLRSAIRATDSIDNKELYRELQDRLQATNRKRSELNSKRKDVSSYLSRKKREESKAEKKAEQERKREEARAKADKILAGG